jgi:MoxR-like ATPase
VFANVVVADEINRATPKTQSALLEAMEERQATIEGQTFDLPEPFVVIATQNPIEMEGTYELPEAQRDRFQQKLIIDLPDREHERELFERFQSDPFLGPDAADKVVEPTDILDAQETVSEVHVADALREYVLDVVRATRAHESVEYGASPRATLAFLNGGRARAAIEGREYVLPGDVKALAEPVLAHRLVLTTDAELGGRTPREVVRAIVDDVATPSGSLADDADADPTVPAED